LLNPIHILFTLYAGCTHNFFIVIVVLFDVILVCVFSKERNK